MRRNERCGKCFLMRVLYQSLYKIFLSRNSDLEKTWVTLLAQAGVAAFNLNATTRHSELNIPAWCFGKNVCHH